MLVSKSFDSDPRPFLLALNSEEFLHLYGVICSLNNYNLKLYYYD